MLQPILYSLVCCISIFIQPAQTAKYQCLPCGQDCDKVVYDKPGNCSSCQMELVKSNTIHFQDMPPSQVCDYIKSHPNLILLDVRTRQEFRGQASPNYGTLQGAINIPIQELPARLKELAAYKNREILVFCSHSHRSPSASYLLEQNGFGKVINMSGGMSVFNGPCKK